MHLDTLDDSLAKRSCFSKKALCFGEIHGIENTTAAKLGIIRGWLKRGLNVAVALERDHDQQPLVHRWLRAGKPDEKLKSAFRAARTASFLSDQYSFLQGLADAASAASGKLRVICVDISFSRGRGDSRSASILSCKDGDEFDREREAFIVGRLKAATGVLDAADRVLFTAGNMHASRTANYFPLREKPCRHISTAAGWLGGRYGCESIYTLPFSGHNRYQSGEGLKKRALRPDSPVFNGLLARPFDGFRPVTRFGIANAPFLKSYDWLFGVKKCRPSVQVQAR